MPDLPPARECVALSFGSALPTNIMSAQAATTTDDSGRAGSSSGTIFGGSRPPDVGVWPERDPRKVCSSAPTHRAALLGAGALDAGGDGRIAARNRRSRSSAAVARDSWNTPRATLNSSSAPAPRRHALIGGWHIRPLSIAAHSRLRRKPLLLVPGGIVQLSLGNIAPADLTIISGAVVLDQSVLTGESVPVEAGPDKAAYAGGLVRLDEAIAEIPTYGVCET
jgi:hypothetical protein